MKKRINKKRLLITIIMGIAMLILTGYSITAAPGDDCSQPIIVNIPADLDYLDFQQTTCGRGNDYINTCLSPYDTGEDIIYELIVSTPITVDITLNPYGIDYTGILIDDECPDGDGSCIAYSINSYPPTPHGISNLYLTTGTYYVMIDSYDPETNCIELFDLAIDEAGQGDLEFGDAPEDHIAYPSTGTFGWFPTCITCGTDGWIQHNNFGAYFGPGIDFESDGNAGFCPNGFPPYDQDEGYMDNDAGLIIPEPFTIDATSTVVPFPGFAGTALGKINQVAVWGTDVDIDVHNTMPGHDPYLDAYVNVLMDWNQDGDWKDAGEHVLVDFVVPALYIGPLSSLGPPSFTIGPNPGYVWSRFTITESPLGVDWFGEGNFEDGETEDYLLLVEDECEPSIDIEKYVWDANNGLWVDADASSDAVDFSIGSIAEFKITIHNDGTCCNLTEIWVDDIADTMEVVDYTILPDYYTYTPGQNTNLGWWSFVDEEPLPPCNWINLTIWAEIEGTHCNTYSNHVWVEAYCEDQDIYVEDFDECYVHAVNPEEFEFGDAPEDAIAYPSTMTPGSFPTCMCCGPAGFVRHNMLWDGLIFLGNMKDNEIDGNAGFCPLFPPYDQDEGYYPGPDGGLMAPDIYTIDNSLTVVPLTTGGLPYLGFINGIATWGIETDLYVQNWAPVDAFVNVLADWNQNGQWGDAGEHVLINHPVPAGFNGPLSVLTPPPIFIGPNPGYVWCRYTISAIPVPDDWDGAGDFEDGETEDYLLLVEDDDPPTACYTWVDADGSGAGTTIDFDASCSIDDLGIITYEWDWTNDGIYELSSSSPTVSYDYGDTNPHDCTLRVTDTGGQTDTITNTVQAIIEVSFINQSVSDRGFPIRHAADGDWAGAQNFSASGTLTRVQLYLRRFGSPQFNLTVELRESSPTGTLLDTKIFTPSQTPSSWEWFNVDFTDTPVSSSGDYFIVCPPAPLGVSTSFGYEWGYAFGSHYWPGSFWFTRDGGGLWRDLPTMYEFVFSVYGY